MRHRTTNFPFLVTIVAFMLLSVGIIYFLLDNGQAYDSARQAYTDELHFEKRLLDVKEWVPGLSAETAKLNKARIYATEAQAYWQTCLQLAWALAGLVLVFLLLCYVLKKKAGLVVGLIVSALACLVVGIFAPMMEIMAYEEGFKIPIQTTVDIPFTSKSIDIDISKVFGGEMYFFYQNKSIASLITTLLSKGNYAVGLSILAFSVLVPLLKLFMSLLILINVRFYQYAFVRWVSLYLGKWSMADVFVAGCFLSYLSFNNMSTGLRTHSDTLMGMYFFLAYCMLSLFSGSMLAAMKNK